MTPWTQGLCPRVFGHPRPQVPPRHLLQRALSDLPSPSLGPVPLGRVSPVRVALGLPLLCAVCRTTCGPHAPPGYPSHLAGPDSPFVADRGQGVGRHVVAVVRARALGAEGILGWGVHARSVGSSPQLGCLERRAAGRQSGAPPRRGSDWGRPGLQELGSSKPGPLSASSQQPLPASSGPATSAGPPATLRDPGHTL